MLKRCVVVILCAMLLSSCASSNVLVGEKRPPISPDRVKIYLEPPANFEKIALLESSSRNSFTVTPQGKTNKVMKRLQAEAAKLGANGVLLENMNERYLGSVHIGSAIAIFVPEPVPPN